MKLHSNSTFNSNSFVKLHDHRWLKDQRIAGEIVQKALKILEGFVITKTTKSLIELNEAAEKFITDSGAELTFKGYKGFPAGVCISVNEQLVHGIPSDYHLKDGDIVSFDLGATVNGAIADAAITCIYGEPKSEKHVNLIKHTKEALDESIKSIAVGKKIGCIGSTIYKFGTSKGYSVITQYGGHGLALNTPHAPPFIANKALKDDGIRIQEGMTIAIEPMFVLGSSRTRVTDDGWTVMTDNISCHFEHSVFVHENYVEIITGKNEN